MTKLETGTRIADYILGERLGAGSFGEVWMALHVKDPRIVAIKFATSDDAAAALVRDGVPERDLAHPSIVRVHAVDAAHEPPYVVLEHVEGRTLRQLLRERGRFEPQDVGAIFRQLVDALAHAHERGVVHGDVKPENVLVIEQGMHKVVKLTDFQIGAPKADRRATGAGRDGVRPSLKSAVVSGTYHYLAPEQEAGEEVDGRADLYALGVVLFEMATGSLPQGRDLPSDLNPALSWWWDHIFSRCYTGKDRRYKDAAELRADLRAVYAGAPEWGALPSQAAARAAAARPAPRQPGTGPVVVLARRRHDAPPGGGPCGAATASAAPGRLERSRKPSSAPSLLILALLLGVPLLQVCLLFAGAVVTKRHARAEAQAARQAMASVACGGWNVAVPSSEMRPAVVVSARASRVESSVEATPALYGTVPDYAPPRPAARDLAAPATPLRRASSASPDPARERAAREQRLSEAARAAVVARPEPPRALAIAPPAEITESEALEQAAAAHEAARLEASAQSPEGQRIQEVLNHELAILLELRPEAATVGVRSEVDHQMAVLDARARRLGFVLRYDMSGNPYYAPAMQVR